MKKLLIAVVLLISLNAGAQIGVGTTSPSAVLHLKAGTSAASTAPLKFTAGTNLATTEAGAIEYDGVHLYFTATNGGTRYQLDQQPVDTSDIFNFYLKVRGLSSGTAPITYNPATGAIGITQAGSSSNGYLSSTDWNTFNNKLGSVDTSNISNFYLKVRSLSSGTAPITFNSATGAIGISQSTTSTDGYLSSTDWNTFNNKLGSVDTSNISNFYLKVRSLSSGTAPITFNSATGAIGITQATTSTNGYLSSTDWNTFNSKASSFSTGNLTETGSSVLTITGGTGSVIGSGATVQVKQATTSQSGFLSNTDWNTFNNKLGSVDTSNISNFYLKVRSLSSGTAPITFNSATGAIGISQSTTSTDGYLSSTDWNTFNNKLGSVDTSDISNFYLKVRSLHTVSSPLTYNSATGAIGISQATTSTNGYLSSTDWNTFNSKASSFSTGNLTETGSSVLTITGGTGSVIGSGATVQVKQATTSQSGFLSNTDWNTFNNKLGSVDTSNISNFYLKVRSLNSGTAPITFNSATGAIGITQSTTSTDGYLSSTDWNTFNNKLGSVDTSNISNFYLKVRSLHTVSSPLTYNSATGAIGISQATTSTNGYLSSTDWNTFNSKASSFSTGNLTETGSSVLTITGGTGSVIGSGATVQVKQATTSQSGFLSNTDWNTFNNKLGSVDTSNISNFYLKVRSLSSGTAPITFNSATGAIGISQSTTSTDGYLSSTDWNTFNNKLGSVDTSNISNFYLKVRSLSSGTAPITFNSATGAVGITQATTSTNGYLSSTDWNTFNSKASSFSTGNLTETGSSVLTITGGTGSVIGSGATVQVKQATTSQSGFLSNTDWNTFNNKLGSVDTSNISNFYLKVRSLHTVSSPLTYNSATGAIAISQATTSTNGYLSSTDWNTFNNKTSSQWTTSGSDIYYTTGNVGIGTSTFSGTNPESLIVDAGTDGTGAYQNVIVGKGNTNSYAQLNIQNGSSGTAASSDVVATANNGSESVNFIDMGINGGGNTSTGVLGGANKAYLYSTGNDFAIGNSTASKNLIFFTGGTGSSNERMRIDGTGDVGIGTTSPISLLDVNGSVGFAIRTTSSSTTLDGTDHTVIITGSTPTITLPAASSNARRIYVIVNQTAGTRTISSYKDLTGTNTTGIPAQSSITVQSNGTSWYQIH